MSLTKLSPQVTAKHSYLLILKSFLNFPKSIPVYTKFPLPAISLSCPSLPTA